MSALIEIDWKKVNGIIEKYDCNKESLLMIMQDISDLYNYVPPEVVKVLVEKLGVQESLVYGVATFYKTISLEPRGRFIVSVCTGTACHVLGADKITEALQEKLAVKDGQTSADGLFTLDAVRCVGCCASGPVITVNKKTYGGLDRSRAISVVEEYKQLAS